MPDLYQKIKQRLLFYNSLKVMDSSVRMKEKLSEFLSQQQSVGIGLQTFKQKFVFNQNSGPDAIYLDILTPSPSQSQGLTPKQQNLTLYMMSEILFKAGQTLKLPVSTTIVALNIAQYYYTRKSLLDYDFRDIAMGALFLACKSEQTLRRSYQIALVFDYLFKMYEGQKNIRELQLNSPEYNYIKQKVIKTENQLLFQLGFEVYKLFDIPHRYISGLISSFNRHKQCNLIVQYSWSFLNDIYRTKAVVHFPGQVIASASIIMALQKLEIPIPEKPWWILMQASIEQIRIICALTNQMYEASSQNQINILKVSQILQKIGRQSLKVSNVLPVPYYRKIRLESQGYLMKPLEKTIQMQEERHEKGKSPEKMEDENHKERSKKQKKKHKKKHKNYSNGNRNRSQSSEIQVILKKGKYQNDDETPKIRSLSQSLPAETFENLQHENKSMIDQIVPAESQPDSNKMVSEQSEIKVLQLNQTTIMKQQSVGPKQQSVGSKKSVLLDAKSMLSKFSLQIKKLQVKNESLSQEVKAKSGGKVQKESCSQQEDELMAELIQIKKKNLEKKQQGN